MIDEDEDFIDLSWVEWRNLFMAALSPLIGAGVIFLGWILTQFVAGLVFLEWMLSQ